MTYRLVNEAKLEAIAKEKMMEQARLAEEVKAAELNA